MKSCRVAASLSKARPQFIHIWDLGISQMLEIWESHKC